MTTVNHRNHGAKQALEYMTSEEHRLGVSGSLTAVVCDGATIGFYNGGIDQQGDFWTPKITEYRNYFSWYPVSSVSLRRFLMLIGSHRQSPVTGESLITSFGRGSPIARHFISLAVEHIRNRIKGTKTAGFYREWYRAMEVAYGDLSLQNHDLVQRVSSDFALGSGATLGEALFGLHTYFVLLVRLIALEILAQSVNDEFARPTRWGALNETQFLQQIESLESGRISDQIGVSGVFEGDIFSWYLESLPGDLTFQSSVRGILGGLETFAFPRLAFGTVQAEDLFRELYQGLTPDYLRAALGEFLTPRWLAEAVLEWLQQQGVDWASARVLDPTCGTGTFLQPILAARILALRRSNPDPTSAEVQAVLHSIAGIDINPVAVVAARMNCVMALGELASRADLRLPIWLADSILLPEPPARQITFEDDMNPVPVLELQTSLQEPFVLPSVMVEQEILQSFLNIARHAVEDDLDPDVVKDELDLQFGPRSTHAVCDAETWVGVQQALLKLIRRLTILHREGRNGIWAEVIMNRFAPVFLGHFDVVIGNPPWLTWTRLPEAWRQKARSIWQTYGLWPVVRRGAPLPKSDIAVLVAGVALVRYLKPHGLLGFIMPKALIHAEPGNREFRKYRLTSDRRTTDIPFRPLLIQDMSEVEPFRPEASNSPIVIIIRRDEPPTFPIPGARWSIASRSQWRHRSWQQIRSGYLTSSAVNWQPISTIPTSPLAWWAVTETPRSFEPNQYVFGEGLNTRGANGIYFVTLRSQRVDSDGLIRIANVPRAGRNTQVEERVGTVEAQLVVPLVRGAHVHPFWVAPTDYILLPHDPINRSQALGNPEFREQFPRAWRFLNNWHGILRQRSAYQHWRPTDDVWWGIANIEHMNAGFLVCVREQANTLISAVVRPRWNEILGREVLPVVDHKLMFYNTHDETTAYYLSGVLNATAFKNLAERYLNQIAISPSTIRQLPIPLYMEGNDLHIEIASLTKNVHTSEAGDPGREDMIITLDNKVRQLLTQ